MTRGTFLGQRTTHTSIIIYMQSRVCSGGGGGGWDALSIFYMMQFSAFWSRPMVRVTMTL